ncbi:MAG: hypothetical protein PHH08_05255, partial [Candidatus ainarchaeum sp.]|nr:hypothetical protein [Candidatus ainarchaeum sp.]
DIGAYEYVGSSGGTCSDGVQNNGETGVDCGGSCPVCQNSLSQYGITWTFDKGYRTGQFANGDYWVLGPVTITSMTPVFDGQHNGWEINPSGALNQQGFDTRAETFNAALVPALPRTVNSNSSIVKSISVIPYAQTGLKTYLQTAAVLTVLGTVPSDDGASVFRPAYFGNQKTLYSTTGLQMNILPRLSTSPAIDAVAPTLAAAKRKIDRVQLVHKLGYSGDQIHPVDNFQLTDPYGPDVSNNNTDAALRIMLAKTGDSEAERSAAVIALVQYGIDVFAMRAAGQSWTADGGHDLGMKLPLAFAAVLLNNQAMKDAVSTAPKNAFAETGNTWTSPIGTVIWGQDRCNYGNEALSYWNDLRMQGHESSKDCKDPYLFIDGGSVPGGLYQGCCTSKALKGSALVEYLIPGMASVWNDTAQLTYADRWVSFGTWTQPDTCAPMTGLCSGGNNPNAACTSANAATVCTGGTCDYSALWAQDYGVKFGDNPANPGTCILDTDASDGIGRLPQLHGTGADSRYHNSVFVDAMWAAHRNP